MTHAPGRVSRPARRTGKRTLHMVVLLSCLQLLRSLHCSENNNNNNISERERRTAQGNSRGLRSSRSLGVFLIKVCSFPSMEPKQASRFGGFAWRACRRARPERSMCCAQKSAPTLPVRHCSRPSPLGPSVAASRRQPTDSPDLVRLSLSRATRAWPVRQFVTRRRRG